MPDWFSQFEATPAKEDWFGQFKAEPAPSRLGNVLKGAKDELSGQWEGLKEVGGAALDVGKKLLPQNIIAHPDEAMATLRGGAAGAVQGAKNLIHHPVESLDPTGMTGALKGNEDNWTKGGHAAVLAGEALLPELKPLKRIGAIRAASREAEAAAEEARLAARGNLVKEPVPPIEDQFASILEDGRKPEPAPSVELPRADAQPAVTYPNTKGRLQAKRIPPKGPRQIDVKPPVEVPAAAEAPVEAAIAPEVGKEGAPELPESWKALVQPEAALPDLGAATPKPGMVGMPTDAPMWSRETPTAGTVSDMRGMLGAEDAGAAMGLDADAVRDISGQASRRPIVADAADLDNNYMRQLANERGAVDPALLKNLGAATAGGVGLSMAADDDHKGGAAVLGALGGLAAANPMKTIGGLQKLRVMGMLSGAAAPKSFAGNIGAIGTAAMERGSMAPIREGLRMPTNIREAAHAFANNENPAHIEGIGRFNIPARVMGALDHTTTTALQRAGLTLPEAQRLLLTDPNTMGHGGLGRAMKSPVGRQVFPFQNTPMNTVAEGIDSLNGMIGGEVKGKPKHTPVQRAMTAGSIAAGAGAGEYTDDPRTLALLAAFAGPRAVPMALGMGATAGPRVLEKVGIGLPEGSFADLYNPTRPIMNPSLINFLKYLRGEPATDPSK